ncbi:hypothetical protein K438DRAFT_1879013, partial [Mycena galopus ATCC 62051]
MAPVPSANPPSIPPAPHSASVITTPPPPPRSRWWDGEGSWQEGSRQEGPRREGPRQEGTRREGSRQEISRQGSFWQEDSPSGSTSKKRKLDELGAFQDPVSIYPKRRTLPEPTSPDRG